MLAVVDANIVFSALISKGKPFSVFMSNKALKYYEFTGPEYLLSELEEKWERIISYTHLDEKDLDDVYTFIISQISIASLAEFSDLMPEATKLNPKDAPYLALAMKLGSPIISGDIRLSGQKRVEIIPPAKALGMILSSQ
ncbi:MAG: PIN domain-containing protein [Candidatus Altiarchaeia archaeon]